MQADLEKLQAGGSFDEFARRTRRTWQSMALKLLQRWQCPTDVGVEDLVQEMLLAVWIMLPKYDPSRGKTLSQFVIWNSVNRAKKFVHRQRGAKRRDDKSLSRHPIAMSSMADPKVPYEERIEFEADQEREVEKSKMVERVCPNARTFAIGRLVVKNEGDIEAALDELFAGPSARTHRIGSRAEAQAIAYTVLNKIADAA